MPRIVALHSFGKPFDREPAFSLASLPDVRHWRMDERKEGVPPRWACASSRGVQRVHLPVVSSPAARRGLRMERRRHCPTAGTRPPRVPSCAAFRRRWSATPARPERLPGVGTSSRTRCCPHPPAPAVDGGPRCPRGKLPSSSRKARRYAFDFLTGSAPSCSGTLARAHEAHLPALQHRVQPRRTGRDAPPQLLLRALPAPLLNQPAPGPPSRRAWAGAPRRRP